jgi:putative SOS response-associated peptidase YedK
MCNLYAVRKTVEEVASYFEAEAPKPLDAGADTAKGGRGLIVRAVGNGRRVVQALRWGFPRLTREMRERNAPPEPVNLVANLTSPMWAEMVVDPRYRCLIPVEQFAEPDGLPGKKTRTWFGVKGEPLFAWAGFCRNTDIWGPCYGGMTSDSNDAVKRFNPRMPALLHIEEWDRWLSCHMQGVIGIQFRTYPADRLTITPSDEPWIPRHSAPKRHEEPQFL